MAWFRTDPLFCRRSARTDLQYWLMLLVGAAFAYGGFTIEPASNCNDSGECAPWLVPIAAVMGLGFVAMALGPLITNPQRGLSFDPATSELRWWQNRTDRHPGDAAQIPVGQIASIRLIEGSDSDEIHVYDQAGERLPYLDETVIPGSIRSWAEAMVARWPHIRLTAERERPPRKTVS
ncbi:hypothetical protein ACFOON_09565 [Novosphingobium piscinae]|uniref:Uncharacterized protein n=1 Tax=Novosphingobium piscinae TaxID=1507448 RepID=A0A7X1KR58_9SPHN|nr:hypothetical protein [Novosphingobium piscinae]MBC2670439.1 hypothetical protein [Novosphingobium piscinae]